MEKGRTWAPDLSLPNTRIQRTLSWTYQSRHPNGFTETLQSHFPYDTIPLLLKEKPKVVISSELGARTVQALIYRLSGDMNPLHADPDFAKLGGYDRPILHGLCTYGHAGRAVLKAYCNNEPARMKSFEVRFSGVVYPGETITTDMWQIAPGKIVLTARTERGEAVLSSAAAEVVP